MQIDSKYAPTEIEKKWYSYWMEKGFFHSEPDERPSYTIVIPPPNVTGVLHMGHMLNNTIQDILIRKARMSGYNACWVPGTDHASIATEAKVVNRLKEKGINKSDVSREEFLEHAWEWTHEHGGIILEQLKKLGASCDWERTRFTLDDKMYESVIRVFVDLHEKGLIYRGYRMVNWDPQAKTNISDEEVNYVEKSGNLYFVKYALSDSQEFITVATTRPETIFGDTALAVNPNDERLAKFIGKTVTIPIVNRTIPVIGDDYVDMEFGTGALKITPAHDINDYALGQKHNLEIIDALDDDGKLNHHGLHYEGRDRFDVRKAFAKELDEQGFLLKTEQYTNKVGTSERTGAVIEPKLSVQWYLRMQEFANQALNAVEKDELKLFPERYVNTWNHWLNNIQDWNISRQLWWGHRIPAYFYGKGIEDFVVAENLETAVEKAKVKLGRDITKDELKQDEDALDTWFSSWIWPISVFDGINQPDNAEINYYYPTQDLVTGPDIIFFWVARMVMSGYHYREQPPFKNVYFTGIVRDKLRRKMSKSLGNSPDPLQLIEQYGADGVRVGLMLSASAGNDLLFDEELCLQGRNFANKIWNAFRLIQGWETADKEQEAAAQIANEWFGSQMQEALADMESNFEKFRISDALMTLYKLIWDDYCSVYLEAIKPAYGEPIDAKSKAQAIGHLEQLMKLLHPFMPFITEEIWHLTGNRDKKDAIIIADYPKSSAFDAELNKKFSTTIEVVTAIRNLRNEKGISPKEVLEIRTNSLDNLFPEIIQKLANTQLQNSDEDMQSWQSFRVGTLELFADIGSFIDTEAELQKLQQEKEYQQKFLESVRKKLSNEKFVSGAPEQVVAMERKKESDSLEKLALIEKQMLAMQQ
ncbi:MAG: valine--tRNA ligase [Weeksellaceae bacterium]|nr:valine--tRNA ligase [Weeksellaceae bacterium]